MCEKMSNEKVAVMQALGARLIKTPITADSYSAEGIFGVANRLHKEIPDSLILDQVRKCYFVCSVFKLFFSVFEPRKSFGSL